MIFPEGGCREQGTPPPSKAMRKSENQISHPEGKVGNRAGPAVGPRLCGIALPPGETLGPTIIAPLFSADLTPRCGLGERSSGRLRKNDSRAPRRSTLVHRHRTTTTPAQPYTSEQRRRLAASLSSIATRTLCATKTTETPASTPARPPTHLRSTGGRSKRFQRENDRWPRSAHSDATPSASS